MKREIDLRWVLVLILALALIAGLSIYWARREPETPQPPPPPPTPTVTVVPDQVPITPPKDAIAPKPGTLPDNGVTPPDATAPVPEPQQFDAPADGFGGNVTFAPRETATVWSSAQAVVYAAGQVSHPDKNYYALCAHFVSWVYGFEGYGMVSAKAGGNAVPTSRRHKMTATPPAGAIVYFIGNDTGPYGHVILSAGDGTYYSNDIVSRGRISRVKISLFAERWGMRPSFYTNAYLPWSFGHNPNPAPKIVEPTPWVAPPSVGPRIVAPGTLPIGWAMWSPGGGYAAVMQADGNFVVYGRGRAVWSSRTSRHAGATLVMQADGNLVIYWRGKAIWSTHTWPGHPRAMVQMQADGNLVVYRIAKPKALWSSKYGRA